MADRTELDDWEVLQSSDAVLLLSSDEGSAPFEAIEAVSDDKGMIKPDYFALDSGDPYSIDGNEDGLLDSGNSSFPCLERPKFELGFAGIDPSHVKDPKLELGSGGIDSGRQSCREDGAGYGFESVDEKVEAVRVEDGTEVSEVEMGFNGIDAWSEDTDKDAAFSLKEAKFRETDEIVGREGDMEKSGQLGTGETVRLQDGLEDTGLELVVATVYAGDKNSDKIDALKEAGSGGTKLIEGKEAEDEIHSDLGSGKSGHQKSSQEIKFKEAEFGRNEQTEGREAGALSSDNLGSGESASVEDSMEGSNEDVTVKSLSSCEGEKKGKVWLKLPLDLLKFCVLRARPVWSISVAAAIVGIVILGKKLYRMKHKSKSIPLKVRIDDKKASQIMVHAARLNDAFSVARRVPIIRSPLPASGVSLWPVVGLL